MPERVSPRREQRLRLRATQSRLQRGGMGDHIEVDQPIQTPKVERDEGLEPTPQRLDPADHARSPTERHHRHFSRRAQLQDFLDLIGARRQHDRIRRTGSVTASDANQIAVGLAAGMGYACLGIVVDDGERFEPATQLSRQRRRLEVDLVQRHRRRGTGEVAAEALLEKGAGGRGDPRALRRITPAIPRGRIL